MPETMIIEIGFHYNLQRVLREYLVKEWEGQGKKYYITPVTGESSFEKVYNYLECPHKYPNLPPERLPCDCDKEPRVDGVV